MCNFIFQYFLILVNWHTFRIVRININVMIMFMLILRKKVLQISLFDSLIQWSLGTVTTHSCETGLEEGWRMKRGKGVEEEKRGRDDYYWLLATWHWRVCVHSFTSPSPSRHGPAPHIGLWRDWRRRRHSDGSSRRWHEHTTAPDCLWHAIDHNRKAGFAAHVKVRALPRIVHLSMLLLPFPELSDDTVSLSLLTSVCLYSASSKFDNAS